MPPRQSEKDGDPGPPWSATPAATLAPRYCQRFGCQGVAVGLIDVRAPRPDEWFLMHGLDGPLEQVCLDDVLGTDALVRSAMRQGVAVSEADSIDSAIGEATDQPLLVAMQPESLIDQRWWLLILARRNEPFQPPESRAVWVALRQWQAMFSATGEPNMGRLIVGHDNRLLAADVGTQQRMLSSFATFEELVRQIRPTLRQRYPMLARHETRDAVLQVDGASWWVHMHLGGVNGDEGSEQLFVEWREASGDDLPAVGLVGDDRIARAIAYLHDHYVSGPTLAEIAQQVHTSPFHFHRMFSRQVGISPKQYLQRRQLQVAKWLLRSSRAPIGEVAGRTGFSSHGHFTSTFHRVVGMSPSDYREQ